MLSVWDRIERNELAHVVDEAVAAQFPEDPPRFLARVPYGYHDADAIIDELRAAGFVGGRGRDGGAARPGALAAARGGGASARARRCGPRSRRGRRAGSAG